jgi:hypothetical protein
MKQLYANNAKTSLASPLAIDGVTMTVSDGSAFPSPGPFEYFLCTLEVGSSIEVVMVTARSGNTFTIGGFLDPLELIAGRGQEGTGSKAFATGAKVEGRVTKGMLQRYSTAMASIATVDLMVPPRESFQYGYLASTFDPSGNPVAAVTKDATTWKFLNYTPILTKTATAATTTTVTAANVVIPNILSGKYLIQFTSGTQTGKIRVVTGCAANVVTWSGTLPVAPVATDTFEILESNASILLDLMLISDESIIMPLILGGE